MRSLWPAEALAKAASRGMTAEKRRGMTARCGQDGKPAGMTTGHVAPQRATSRRLITNARAFAMVRARHISQPGARRIVMAKGQMRSNKEKKKPKADKNLKKGGATTSPFSSGKMQMQAGQNPYGKK
jgi:hypothetical protein